MGLKLDQYIISILIFSFFIIGSVFILGDISLNYDVEMNTDEFNSSYNTMDDMFDISQDMKDDVMNADVEGGLASAESMIKGSYNAIRIIGRSFAIVDNIIQEVAKSIGVPEYIIQFFLVLVSLSVIFSIIFLVMRLRS